MARALDISGLSGDELMSFMEMACDRLTVSELVRLQEIAEEKRQEKLDEAKQQVIAELKDKLAGMGVSPDEVTVSFGSPRRARRDQGSTLRPKYRGPGGETWSGRGFVPNWLKALEEQGRNREEFRVEEAGPE